MPEGKISANTVLIVRNIESENVTVRRKFIDEIEIKWLSPGVNMKSWRLSDAKMTIFRFPKGILT